VSRSFFRSVIGRWRKSPNGWYSLAFSGGLSGTRGGRLGR